MLLLSLSLYPLFCFGLFALALFMHSKHSRNQKAKQLRTVPCLQLLCCFVALLVGPLTAANAAISFVRMPSSSINNTSSSLLAITQLLFMLLHATTCLPGFPQPAASLPPFYDKAQSISFHSVATCARFFFLRCGCYLVFCGSGD